MLSLKEYKEEYGLFTSICLNITDSCNLRCRYCFVNQKPNFMTLEVAMAAVDYLMKNVYRRRELSNNENIKGTLNFFGGEPMLLYDEIIVPLVAYIERKYPNDINLGITTNGTLLNKERIDFLYDHKILPLLSIDGDRETQEYNRPCVSGESSFDLVERNIPYLLEKFPNTTFRMTIYEDTCDKLFDNILYAEKMGFNNFVCVPDSRNNFSNESFDKLRLEMEKFALYLYGNAQNRIQIIEGEFFNSFLIKTLNIISEEQPPNILFGKDIMRCGLGTASASISPFGDILACQEQSSLTNENNIFYIGNIYDGIDKKRHLRLLEKYRGFANIKCENEQLCEKCPLKNHCDDLDCPSATFERFKNFYTQSINTCKWHQILFEICKVLLEQQNLQFGEFVDYILKKREMN